MPITDGWMEELKRAEEAAKTIPKHVDPPDSAPQDAVELARAILKGKSLQDGKMIAMKTCEIDTLAQAVLDKHAENERIRERFWQATEDKGMAEAEVAALRVALGEARVYIKRVNPHHGLLKRIDAALSATKEK